MERLRILNNSNEQDLERLKRELNNKQVECDGYINEIQILHQKLAELDIELNHRKSQALKLERFLDDEKQDKENQLRTLKSNFEVDFTSLKRKYETKELECSGYIKEIEELNQEIFRLKGLLRPEREVEAHYTTSYIMPPKGVTVTREVVVPQESSTTEAAQSSTFGRTEFMVDVKEKTKPVEREISNYEINPKRMVKIRSPFEARGENVAAGAGTSKAEHTKSTVTKITRIQRSVSPSPRFIVEGGDESSFTVVSSRSIDSSPPVSPSRIIHLESSSSPKLNRLLDSSQQSNASSTLNVADVRSHTSTNSSSTVMTKVTQLQTMSSVSDPSLQSMVLGTPEFRIVSSSNGIEGSSRSQEQLTKSVISQVDGSSSPIRVKVEAEEKLEFEPVRLHVERAPLQTTSSSGVQTVVQTQLTTREEGADGFSRVETGETGARTRKVRESREQRAEITQNRKKDDKKISEV